MKTILFVIALAFLASACTSTSSGDPSGTTVFPSSLAVASPFSVLESDSSITLMVSGKNLASASYVTYYAWATGQIDQVLAATTHSQCRFDPNLFLKIDQDAGCFGPRVSYENHPDATDPSDPLANGTLPIGDVGLWTEEDATTGHACAAAELNARMEGVQDKSLAALMGLASLICTVNANGLSLPSNSTLDLSAEMNGLGISEVSFRAATITHSNASGSDEWSYTLDFDYTPAFHAHHIVVALLHVPGGSAGEYRGRLSYRVNEDFMGGNCSTRDVTNNGSLLYERNSLTNVDLEVRSGQFCQHDSDGMTDGLVDPEKKFDPGSNPTGWANNFSILTANYNPQNLEGNYAYTWQAGPHDSNSRVFNIHVEELNLAASSASGATAFYGYGADIDGTDGGIDGFICNWTGPNNDHKIGARAQSQTVAFDPNAGLFVATNTNILYAPTNSCDYDGTGSFRYDSDIDAVVDTDPAIAITNDLVSLVDSDGNGSFDVIEATGFVLPSAP